MNLEQVMAPIMQQFREIETCIECSAANLVQVCHQEVVLLCVSSCMFA